MKRKIIEIDEDKCTGCGQCVPDCPEGAIQIIDGKARLISDLFCDGLGACIGTCPEGAICVVEREAAPYDEKKVMENIVRQGPSVIKAHLEHLAHHGQTDFYNQAIEYLNEHKISVPGMAQAGGLPHAPATGGIPHAPHAGCPGSMMKSITRNRPASGQKSTEKAESELRQWPVQLKLLNPAAPYFDNADLLISADCVPFAYAGFHTELLRDKIVIIFCPKLDSDLEGYVTKLAEIFKRHTIKSITVARMEVPCCSGVRSVVDKALERSEKKIEVREKIITIQGDLK
ncbi:ATP-binding protein [Methanocella arvoryzae]|uniref:4Fe-4S ferredoxin-domain protein n=1 Tax=Methanocella arvoryzae (strain DSM 22066 / NBRC 105507 / MRE50) TaxID=351160 RepID=Q0W800_METAR|nr:4Fe-4S binding protein [Methanocella arvoryzae]CAJ35493.1 4Fe-4S ferredoxin-domain protein [Methanocella arvoryzae MRE50]